mgnify:FL=1
MKRRSLLIGSILTSLGLANKIYDSQINTEEEKQSKNKHYDPPWKVKVNNFNLNHIEHRKNELYIHHINVGQADATFIKTPNGKNILIDSGHAIDNGVFVLDYLKSYSINHLDYFILTHPHWDHIGGTKRIIETYEQKLNGISKILETKQKNETYTYKEYRDILNKYPRKVEKIDENVELDWDTNIKVTILNPTEKLDKELTINNKSIALHIEHNNNSIILPSDIEKETENRIIKKYGSKIESDIYRIAHHGDRRSNSDLSLTKLILNMQSYLHLMIVGGNTHTKKF